MEPRNFESDAAASPPAAPAVPSHGYPTNGNPGGQPATWPGAHWVYKMGESLRNIIVAAGLTPSDEDLTLLVQAIQKLGHPIKDALYAPNGYVVFDGGDDDDFIVVWGAITVSGGSFSNWTFPIAFPNAMFQVFGGWNQGSYSSSVKAGFISGSPTLTQVPVGVTDSTGTYTLRLFALGN